MTQGCSGFGGSTGCTFGSTGLTGLITSGLTGLITSAFVTGIVGFTGALLGVYTTLGSFVLACPGATVPVPEKSCLVLFTSSFLS